MIRFLLFELGILLVILGGFMAYVGFPLWLDTSVGSMGLLFLFFFERKIPIIDKSDVKRSEVDNG